MNRRHFLQGVGLIAVGVATAGVASVLIPPAPDPYGEEFMSRVGDRVRDIVRETGRPPRRLEIAAPEMKNGAMVRHVVVDLEIGSSLLDVNRFSWWQPVI
jgi:hypothetical protein